MRLMQNTIKEPRTVYLGSTNGLTLFQSFYSRNVPKRVIVLSSGIQNIILDYDTSIGSINILEKKLLKKDQSQNE